MAEYFVATDGTPGGTGKINDPNDLQTVLSTTLLPGDRVFLRQGTYKKHIAPWNVHDWTGTDAFPIFANPYEDEIVKFDGKVAIANLSEYIEWRGFEHFNTSWTTRTTAIPGSTPPDITVPDTLVLGSDHHRITSCIIHDGRNGILDVGNGSEISSCIFFNQGWLGPDRGHGHSLYVNRNDGPTQLVKNNVFAQGFSGWGLHAYSGGVKLINDLKSESNISIDNIMLAQATAHSIDDIHFENNEIFNADIKIGHPVTLSTNVVVKDNYIGDGNLVLQNCVDVIDEGNIATNSSGGNRIQSFQMGERWAVAIYNWEGFSKVKVDLYNKGLKNGFKYMARNAQDYFRDYFFFTYYETFFAGSQAIDFPMTDHSVAIPYKHDVPLENSSFPDFGCFIIEEVGRDFHGRQEISPWTN